MSAALSADTRPLAIVTGGARRVGRAICLALGGAGCDVLFTYHTSEREARATRDEVRALGVEASVAPLDLNDAKAVEAFGESVATSRPRVDVLVHNASTYEPSPLESVTTEQAMRHYQVNALAPLLLTRALAGRLRESPRPGGGAVVAMCDIHAMDRPRRNYAAYNLSKAALSQMVASLALDLAPRVRVNGVAPGVVAFPESGHESDPEMQRRYLSRVPLGRSGTVEEAAEAVRWLALSATYTTGQIIRIDGGRSLT